jgi:hypothetical protein
MARGFAVLVPETRRPSGTADCEARALARLSGELGHALLHLAHDRL